MPHSCDTCGYGRRSGTLMTGSRCPVVGCHGRITDGGDDTEFCPDCARLESECTCGTATWCPTCGCEPDDPSCDCDATQP